MDAITDPWSTDAEWRIRQLYIITSSRLNNSCWLATYESSFSSWSIRRPLKYLQQIEGAIFINPSATDRGAVVLVTPGSARIWKVHNQHLFEIYTCKSKAGLKIT